jgi:hypothetical protein
MTSVHGALRTILRCTKGEIQTQNDAQDVVEFEASTYLHELFIVHLCPPIAVRVDPVRSSELFVTDGKPGKIK